MRSFFVFLSISLGVSGLVWADGSAPIMVHRPGGGDHLQALEEALKARNSGKSISASTGRRSHTKRVVKGAASTSKPSTSPIMVKLPTSLAGGTEMVSLAEAEARITQKPYKFIPPLKAMAESAIKEAKATLSTPKASTSNPSTSTISDDTVLQVSMQGEAVPKAMNYKKAKLMLRIQKQSRGEDDELVKKLEAGIAAAVAAVQKQPSTSPKTAAEPEEDTKAAFLRSIREKAQSRSRSAAAAVANLEKRQQTTQSSSHRGLEDTRGSLRLDNAVRLPLRRGSKQGEAVSLPYDSPEFRSSQYLKFIKEAKVVQHHHISKLRYNAHLRLLLKELRHFTNPKAPEGKRWSERALVSHMDEFNKVFLNDLRTHKAADYYALQTCIDYVFARAMAHKKGVPLNELPKTVIPEEWLTLGGVFYNHLGETISFKEAFEAQQSLTMALLKHGEQKGDEAALREIMANPRKLDHQHMGPHLFAMGIEVLRAGNKYLDKMPFGIFTNNFVALQAGFKTLSLKELRALRAVFGLYELVDKISKSNFTKVKEAVLEELRARESRMRRGDESARAGRPQAPSKHGREPAWLKTLGEWKRAVAR